jgi:septum formation protein
MAPPDSPVTARLGHPGGVVRPLVLASASFGRLGVLRAAGFDPDVVVSGVAEDEVTGAPADLALDLAERKAVVVAERLGPGDHVVVGCDSVLDVDGEVRGKPVDLEQARAWWGSVAGRTAVLRTGHCVVDGRTGTRASAVSSTVVRYGTPTSEEMDAYLGSGEPLGVAGGFTLDGRSAPFVEGIDGDPGTVIGLSLPTMRALLAELDISIVELWP